MPALKLNYLLNLITRIFDANKEILCFFFVWKPNLSSLIKWLVFSNSKLHKSLFNRPKLLELKFDEIRIIKRLFSIEQNFIIFNLSQTINRKFNIR